MSSLKSGLQASAALSLLLSLTVAHAQEAPVWDSAKPLLLAQGENGEEASSEAVEELDPVEAAEKAVEDARAALRQAMATGGDVGGARRNLQAAIKNLNEVREQAGLEPSEDTPVEADSAETPTSPETLPEEAAEAPPAPEQAPAAAPQETPTVILPQTPPAPPPTLAVPQTPPPELPTLAPPEPQTPEPPAAEARPAESPAPAAEAASPPPATPVPDAATQLPPTLAPPRLAPGEAAVAAPTPEVPAAEDKNAETDEERGFFSRLFGRDEKKPEGSGTTDQASAPSSAESSEAARTEKPSLPIFKELPPIDGPKVVAVAPDETEVVKQDDERRVIVKDEGQLTIKHDDNDRFRRRGEQIKVEEGTDDSTITTVTRPNGTEVITVRNASGDIVQRYRKDKNGKVEILIGDRDRSGRPRQRPGGQGPSSDRPFDFGRTLPKLQIQIPRDQYIVGSHGASRASIEEALIAPPVETIERPYSLEEIRRSERLRAKLRRIDVDTVNFEFGADTIAEDQVPQLQAIGNALSAIIAEDPNEVFLIEGHTDAVGTDPANLALSDRRAESIAVILSYYFDIPPENLVTQGYGEQYLKVLTATPERQNRRVSVRRITPLLVGQL